MKSIKSLVLAAVLAAMATNAFAIGSGAKTLTVYKSHKAQIEKQVQPEVEHYRPEGQGYALDGINGASYQPEIEGYRPEGQGYALDGINGASYEHPEGEALSLEVVNGA